MKTSERPRRSAEDATEALIDKMSKDSFPASDPPQVSGAGAAHGDRDDCGTLARDVPAAVAELELGEEIEGTPRDVTLVLGGRDAAILHVVADGRRLQLALPCNPLEVGVEDLDALVAALSRARRGLRADPPS